MYKLSPSDFAYLWNDCKHCYYQKVRLGVTYSSPFPAMFGRINGLLQTAIMGMNLQDVHPDLPSGTITVQEGYMRSKPILDTNLYLSGRFDILTKLDDGTYAIIDFKITTPDVEKILKKYSSQLHAYKFALENPGDGKTPIKISKMGAVSINPDQMKLENGRVVFTATPTYHAIEEDMDSFYSLIREISEVLNGELPPESDTCTLCMYRKFFKPKTTVADDIPF